MSTKDLKVEYLITVKADSDFCADIKGLNSLLESNKNISINDGEIAYKDIEVKYEIHTDHLEKENLRFFYTEFQFGNVNKLKDFENLLSDIKEIIYKTGNAPQILWDDISFYYSKEAYPLIFEVENLMRKLITKFMLTNVGMAWAKENIPAEVKDSVKGSKAETPDFLYKTDFIQLEKFLFKKYSTKHVGKLFEKIVKAKNESDLKLDELILFVPHSNWEKYFSDLVDCEGEYLSKRWEKLYDLRNKVAHNRGLIRKDYEDIVNLSKDIRETLYKAIESLDRITLTKSQREEIAESTSDISIFGEFLTNYESLMRHLGEYVDLFGGPDYKLDSIANKRLTVDKLLYKGVLSKQEHNVIREAFDIREEISSGKMYIADTPKITKLSRDLGTVQMQINSLVIELLFSEEDFPIESIQ
ncbi:HEPN domain-containing protein [Bacillus mycoides]|uniref:HEPN domain-containing protein n=1 Tax=Bacillus mycoides TaxID=1405 RepID=UPI000B4B3F45|nr:HEPN domain-containing protein [Bacillus mycoides]